MGWLIFLESGGQPLSFAMPPVKIEPLSILAKNGATKFRHFVLLISQGLGSAPFI